jgi:proteasome accessory factor A
MLLGALAQLYSYRDSEYKMCPYAKLSRQGDEFLPNGSRAYWDHGYLEYATPACVTTADVVAAVRAGDQMIRKAISKLQHALGNGTVINAVRNNIDHQGHSFGAHVNIRMTRKGYERIFKDSNVLNGFVVPFFLTLPVICGSGRCSSENNEEIFQIWQRSDFLQELVGLQTTYDRPLINTRDEALTAEPQKYARFHVIAFDANRLEVSEYLKLGLLRLLCAAIDAERIDVALELYDPIKAITNISRDPFKAVCLASNKSITALEIQGLFLDAFTKLHEQNIFSGLVPDAAEILTQWDHVLTKLEKDTFSLIGTLDWITKYAWLEQIRSNKGLKWSSPQMKWLDIQYHSLAKAHDIPCEHITANKHIDELMRKAPQNCRAAVRGELLRRFGTKISEANWHYVVTSEDEFIYLLPDDPEPGTVETVKKARRLKEAAASLGIKGFQLNYLDGLQEPVKVRSGNEKQTETVL